MVSTVQTEAIKIFGPPIGAAGVRVIERVGTNRLNGPNFGAIALVGPLKRGPSGVPIPVTTREQYDRIFGDPRDSRWHLFPDGSFLTPDVVDGFFTTSVGAGMIWMIRLDLDGEGKKSQAILRNRYGTEVLRFTAGNEGRWGGYGRTIEMTPLIVTTSKTFTIYAPDVQANELVGAIAQFSSGSGKEYEIVANTKAFSSGEVVFTVSSQYDLIADGVHGPVTVPGTARYSRLRTIAGTVSVPLYSNLTGTATISELTVTGTGTRFDTELRVGDNVYYQGEARAVESISSATTLTISETFTADGTGVALQKDNLTVTGTGTDFTTQNVGDALYVVIDGKTYNRTIAAIANATTLTLESGFPVNVGAGSQAQVDNFWVAIAGNTNLAGSLNIGDSVIDPNRRGEAVQVAEIDAAGSRIRVNKQFSRSFTDAQLVRQNQEVQLTLKAPNGTGLAVEVTPGIKYPNTHFGLTFYFNGSRLKELDVADASLDPNDPLYVIPLVNDRNVAYRTGTEVYYTWIEVENLFAGAYTTAQTNDVRPWNGSGDILALTQRRIYTVGDFDYARAINAPLYPNPYKYARQLVRIKGSQAPVTPEGTLSTTGVEVYGSESNFRSVFKKGDYLYDPTSNSVRMVRLVIDDARMTLDTRFAADIPAGTAAKKAGYLQVDLGIDLTKVATAGDRFLLSFPEYLTGGYDGDFSNINPYHYTKFLNTDTDILGRAVYGSNLGLVRIACPDRYDTAVQVQGANYASQTAFEYVPIIPPTVSSAAEAEAFVNLDLGRDNFISPVFPSYGLITNPLTFNSKRLIPLIGDLMGIESYQCNLHSGYHFPSAGIDARLNRIEELTVSLSPKDQATLNNAGIRPIIRMFGRTIPFGAEIPATDGIYTFLHVRRIQSNYVRLLLESMPLIKALFKPNQPDLADRIDMMLDTFFREEYRNGVLNNFVSYEQAIQITVQSPLSKNNVTGESARDMLVSLANGDLEVYVTYLPTGILKNLYINLGPDLITASFTA
jgi:hypothetical protein